MSAEFCLTVSDHTECLGDDCEVNTDGELVGSWYFAPSNAELVYILNPDATARTATRYVPDTDYVTFGHWLAVDDVTVHTYAILPTGSNTVGLDLARDTSAGAVNTATYTGDAVGMSVQ